MAYATLAAGTIQVCAIRARNQLLKELLWRGMIRSSAPLSPVGNHPGQRLRARVQLGQGQFLAAAARTYEWGFPFDNDVAMDAISISLGKTYFPQLLSSNCFKPKNTGTES